MDAIGDIFAKMTCPASVQISQTLTPIDLRQYVSSISTPFPRKNNTVPHSLIMASNADHGMKDAVYKSMCDYLVNGYTVIYSAEDDPSRAVRGLSRVARNLGIEAALDGFIKNNFLTILGSKDIYRDYSQFDAPALIEQWRSHVMHVAAKGSTFKGILAIGDPSGLLKGERSEQKLVEYELSVGRKPSNHVEAVCMYGDPEVTARLSFSGLIHILQSHYCTIHNGWHYREWQPEYVVGLVSRGIDTVLGDGMSRLVFKTLRLVYNINEQIITSRPGLFEEKLKKITGDQPAALALGLIADVIRKEASFSRIGSA